MLSAAPAARTGLCGPAAAPTAGSGSAGAGLSAQGLRRFRVRPLVAEQLRRVEVEQDLPVRLDVAIVELGGDAGGEPPRAGADPGNVAGDLADAQAGAVVEAVDVGQERRRAGLLLGELEMRPEIRKPT